MTDPRPAPPRLRGPSNWIGPASRIAIGLVALLLGALVVADLVVPGFLAHPSAEVRQSRNLVSRVAATRVLAPLREGRLDQVRNVLAELQREDGELLSIALAVDGVAPIVVGDHGRHWRLAAGDASRLDQIRIPLLADGSRRGELQLAFAPEPLSWPGVLGNRAVLGTAWTIVLALLAIPLYLRRAIRQMDPSASVPERVRSAFDTLTEAIILLDRQGNVLLVNSALSAIVGEARADAIGRPIGALGWLVEPFAAQRVAPPWQAVLARRVPSSAATVRIAGRSGVRSVIVNASLLGEVGRHLPGCLVTLADVTDLEEKTDKLHRAHAALSASRSELVEKNAELTRLATRDPLTGLLNRGTLMEGAQQRFAAARLSSLPLVCLMCDIDFFKSINDGYGHAAGDRVIQGATAALTRALGDVALIGRYGGEEFCAFAYGLPLAAVHERVEQARRDIEATVGQAIGDGIERTVTMSFGLAVLEPVVADAAALIERADQALYEAKRSGRNRVVVAAAAASATEPAPVTPTGAVATTSAPD